VWTNHEVQANGLTIHYRRTGTGGTPIVMVHGATDNGGCWGRTAAAVNDRFTVIAPDARGHGKTVGEVDDYSSHAMAGDLAALIGALELDRPYVIGHSMGANATLALVAGWPEIARAAVVEDPVFRLDATAESEIASRRARMREAFDRRQTQTHADIVAEGRAANPTWHDDEFDAWADAKQSVSASFLFSGPAPTPFDWRQLLGQVRVPLLLVTADAPPTGNGIVTTAAAAVAKGLCPTLEVAHIPGAGHNVRREQFGAFIGAVESFLASHP
jgi:N-formylmaleamate deformylase